MGKLTARVSANNHIIKVNGNRIIVVTVTLNGTLGGKLRG